MIRVIAWLLGIRTVERDKRHIVVKVPRWFGADAAESIARRLIADAEMLDRPLRVRHTDRLIRVDTPASAVVPDPEHSDWPWNR